SVGGMPCSSSFHPAVVTATRMLTPTVRHVTLRLQLPEQQPAPTFLPGQWLDLAAPGLSELGGFSICSTPGCLATDRCLELAVRRAPASPPARWIHEACRPGDRVSLRIGGRCVLRPDEAATRPLLLVAGGIGISPLMSIFRQRVELAEAAAAAAADSLPKTLLLHSAGSPDELAFRDLIADECSRWRRLEARWFVTGQSGERIRPDYLTRLAEELRLSEDGWLAFVCGPPGMAEQLGDTLMAAGLPQDRLRREDWSLGGETDPS
ncbi:hypothetical protein BOX15_Mlig007334g1, partial [Macrostomum lignano]